ncbi:MAG: TrpB-like pyridoxal phosphate-dependent enzyme [Anaerolineae bacterium]|nr:TrpB-like pyridoxal phosphate-dependent enzyme [Anaerolineae bacterium]MDW8070945.1 TrpB-like pyridoxal phosphate-dependent enzyme [Anaerolineae bacterium]
MMTTQNERTRFLLGEHEIPQAWYNVLADLPKPLPPVLHPATLQPVGPDDLAPLFPMALIMQEVSSERYIEIPEPVREMYKLYRPSPLIRARRLEKWLDTPARIYYKYEGVSPAGSHKLNTAIAQAFYNKQEGVKKLATETGAGQWGSALSMAGAFFDIEVEVFMVKVSYYQKPYRRNLMEVYGAKVHPSPSPLTEAGRKILERDPDSPGSLGIAISEAVEVAAKSGGSVKYSLGSVLNHVILHQTVVGEEALQQFALADDYPDVVIGCVGGGSNFAGFALPFLRERLHKGLNTRFIAVEPRACPSLTRGKYAYDYGDTAHLTPLIKMHTLGHTFVPSGIHAGGLRYHGMAPIVAALVDQGLMEAVAVYQNPVFEAAVTFARTEGILPAPESAHAVRVAMDEALQAKAEGRPRVIAFNLSGHGLLDLSAYDAYLSGKLEDFEFPPEALEKSLADLPKVEMI